MTFSIRRVFKNASYTMLSNLLIATFAFFQSIILTRVLGPSLYGVWGIVISFSNFILSFLSFRTSEPFTRFFIEYKSNNNLELMGILVKTAVLIDLITRFFVALFVFLSSPIAATYLAGGIEMIWIYRIYGISLLFGVADNVWYCIMRDQKRYRLIAALPLLISMLQLSGILLLWTLHILSLMNIVTLYLGISVINFIISGSTLYLRLKKSYSIYLNRLNILQIIKSQRTLIKFWDFMKTTYWSSMFSTIIKNGDLLILGYFSSDRDVGIYRLAKSLGSIIQQIAFSLSSVIYQDINELLAEKKFHDLLNGIKRILKILVPVSLVAVSVIMLIDKPIILMIYGNNYDKVPFLFNIQLISIAVILVLFWAWPMSLALDNYLFFLKVHAVISMAGLFLMLVISPYYSIYGVNVVYSLLWIGLYFALAVKSIWALKQKIIF